MDCADRGCRAVLRAPFTWQSSCAGSLARCAGVHRRDCWSGWPSARFLYLIWRSYTSPATA